MAKKKKSMIGLDPLAWLKDEAEDTGIIEEDKAVSKEKPKQKVDAKKTTAKKQTKEKTAKTIKSDNNAVFKIQVIQDISTVADVQSDLKALLSNEKVIIDGEQVERIDAASLQLFYSFVEQAREKGVDIAWRAPSDILRHNAKLLGMEEALQLNNVA